MSILDSINNAEEQADKIIEEAKNKARDIVLQAQRKAQNESDKQIAQVKEDYSKQLSHLQEQIDSKYDKYLTDKKSENSQIADKAKKNLKLASSYIVQQVLNQ